MWSDIPGWSGFLELYKRAAAEAKDGDTFVEVGLGFGRSLAFLARQVLESGKDVAVWGVDPFDRSDDKAKELPTVCPSCKSPYWNKPRQQGAPKGRKK